MTDADRIRIIRCGLLCVAVVAPWLCKWICHADAAWLFLAPVMLAMPPLFALPCSRCLGGVPPAQVQVVLTGVVNTSGAPGTCTTCNDWNATFVLDYFGEVGVTCVYFDFFDTPICEGPYAPGGFAWTSIGFRFHPGAGGSEGVTMSETGTQFNAASDGTQIDCTAALPGSPFSCSIGCTPSSALCSFGLASATVTPL